MNNLQSTESIRRVIEGNGTADAGQLGTLVPLRPATETALNELRAMLAEENALRPQAQAVLDSDAGTAEQAAKKLSVIRDKLDVVRSRRLRLRAACHQLLVADTKAAFDAARVARETASAARSNAKAEWIGNLEATHGKYQARVLAVGAADLQPKKVRDARTAVDAARDHEAAIGALLLSIDAEQVGARDAGGSLLAGKRDAPNVVAMKNAARFWPELGD